MSQMKDMEVGMRDSAKEREQNKMLRTTLSKLFGNIDLVVSVRQSRFELAVAVGLAINDVIVAEDKQTLKCCMCFVRKFRKGHCPFSPLAWSPSRMEQERKATEASQVENNRRKAAEASLDEDRLRKR